MNFLISVLSNPWCGKFCRCLCIGGHHKAKNWGCLETIVLMHVYYNTDHRLRGSASPVLTATHHSYGSLA